LTVATKKTPVRAGDFVVVCDPPLPGYTSPFVPGAPYTVTGVAGRHAWVTEGRVADVSKFDWGNGMFAGRRVATNRVHPFQDQPA
jgi:hypothetical protein